jgi:uncharacterized protein YecE (DUF72 family)
MGSHTSIAMPKLFCGTSGFAYPQWKPVFYPKNVPAKRFLEHYATRLNSVEINYTFRRLPSASTLANWTAMTPPEFSFAVKAHERITHFLHLKNAGEFTSAFFQAVQPLHDAGRLGPVLFQLPPQLRCDLTLLGDFLAILPRAVKISFEFRHASWLNDDVYALLEKHGACLCLAESEKLAIPQVLTAGFVYFRLRKPDYSPEDRSAIADSVRDLLEKGKDIYVFFKHDETPDGALYAEDLLQHVGNPS